MAALTNAERKATALHFIREVFVRMNQTAILDANEVRLLIDGVDTGLNAAAASINQAIDVSIRSKATSEQKALAVAYVGLKRAGAI